MGWSDGVAAWWNAGAVFRGSPRLGAGPVMIAGGPSLVGRWGGSSMTDGGGGRFIIAGGPSQWVARGGSSMSDRRGPNLVNGPRGFLGAPDGLVMGGGGGGVVYFGSCSVIGSSDSVISCEWWEVMVRDR